jgi:hypothetical protein
MPSAQPNMVQPCCTISLCCATGHVLHVAALYQQLKSFLLSCQHLCTCSNLFAWLLPLTHTLPILLHLQDGYGYYSGSSQICPAGTYNGKGNKNPCTQ